MIEKIAELLRKGNLEAAIRECRKFDSYKIAVHQGKIVIFVDSVVIEKNEDKIKIIDSDYY